MEQYYYNHMNKQEQAAYHGILQGISGLADEFQIPALDGETLYNVFFQLVIPDILTDKIMYIFLFFQLGHRFCRTHQLLHTGCHCFLMFPDFRLFKQILRQENQIPGILIIPILKSRCLENLRMIKT